MDFTSSDLTNCRLEIFRKKKKQARKFQKVKIEFVMC